MIGHRHHPRCTGRRITAEWDGKDNRPDDTHPVRSTGEEAICTTCGSRLIVHDERQRFAQPFTELYDAVA